MAEPTKSDPAASPNKTHWWSRLQKHDRWGVFTETTVLASLLLITLLFFVFIQIAEEVTDGETVAFDTAVLRWFRDPADMTHTIGPSWLETAALDMTALGGTTVLILVVLITLSFLWFARKRKAFFVVAAAAIGGQIFNSGLKELFGRQRPDVVPHLAEVHTASFPSGHSMMSAVVYLTLGALLSPLVASRMLRAYIVGVSILLTILVGITRVFLGVHYPTDVLAGWSAGLAWALICLLIARILQRRGKVEQPGEETVNPLHG